MKEIDLETKTLGELFIDENHYIVPGYQRPYEWEEKHLASLIETLKECREKSSAFCVFGTIQLNKNSTSAYEIIDGQQRLVTFWLLTTILSENTNASNLCFILKNHISKDYDSQFNQKSGRYGENYRLLEKLLQKNFNHNEYGDLLDFVLDKIIFVVVYTDFSNNKSSSTEEAIKIFDALNTKGLDLDTKDIFKIKYYDYLCIGDSKPEKIFGKINEAYSNVLSVEGACYKITPDDLLDTFRFWILANRKQEPSNKAIKGSNSDFFNGVNSNPFGEPNIDSADVFYNISSAMKDSQEVLKRLDDKHQDILLMCSRELLRESGYSRIRNLYYIFIYAQTRGNEVTEDIVLNALKMTQLLWKLCSVYYCRVGEIVNEAFELIFNKIVRPYVVEPKKADDYIGIIQSKYEEDTSWIRKSIDNFKTYINGNIFESKKCWLMCFLSYIDDCIEMKGNSYTVKKKAFYGEDIEKSKRWEIEHIASRSLYISNECFTDENNDNLTNKIGNLVFLPANINKSLGHHTKSILNEVSSKSQNVMAVEDFCFKISQDQRSRNYLDAKDDVEGIQLFFNNDFSNLTPSEPDASINIISEIIKNRNQAKKIFLFDTFSEILNIKND